jgi:hypothetical protein
MKAGTEELLGIGLCTELAVTEVLNRKLAGILCIVAAGLMFLASFYYYSLTSMRYLCANMESCLYPQNPNIGIALIFGTSGGVLLMLGVRLLNKTSKSESIRR